MHVPPSFEINQERLYFMISYFESSVRINPDAIFLTYVQPDGTKLAYSYWQTRLIAATLARRLQAAGISQGSSVLIDLPNGPELVFFIIACSYAGLTMVMLDNDLSDSEKIKREMEAQRADVSLRLRIDEAFAGNMLGFVRQLPGDDSQIVKSIIANNRRSRSIMGEGQDAVDDTVHYAERAAHLHDADACACITFVGGRSRRSGNKSQMMRVVPLSWNNLVDKSILVNDALGADSDRFLQERLPFNSYSASESSMSLGASFDTAWQCMRNLGFIEGMQSLVRSIVAKTPFLLYHREAADAMLHDAERHGNMFAIVSEDDLQDLLTIEEWRADALPGVPSRLASYKCILMIDKDRNARTLKRAFELGAPIYVSHGMAEAAGTIGLRRVRTTYDGGILPISGYDIEILDPDEDGFGRIALRGPGVFAGYLNSQTAFTVDHYFVTEERAALINGELYWKMRSENMFVSAGQDIYPVEIAEVLRHVQGVAGVHVFGVKDDRFGMIPVAVIERSEPMLTSEDVAEKTRQWFSNMSAPMSIFVFDQLPRTESGKLDRPAIEAIFAPQEQ